MITKNIKIGSKEVKMAVSAGTARRYRAEFGRDMFTDLAPMADGHVDSDILEKMAYIMAKQGDDTLETPFEEWLDDFGMFDIMNASADIVGLWIANTRQGSSAKKK